MNTNTIDFDAERRADARADLAAWLHGALADLTHVGDRLQLAHRDACACEPITAMAIAPLIAEVRIVELRLMDLIAVRKDGGR